jgi:MFS family permease
LAYIRLNKEGFLSKKVLRGLEGNALGCAFVEPLWALFGGMIFFYQPLFMKALNLTEVQMGLLNSIAGAIAVFTSFIAGPVTDRLGRKRTTLIFDLIGWSLSMLIWAVSQNFWFFLAAVFTNAFSKIPATSWTCLAVEDTPLDKRPVFFGLITIIVTGAGIFTPITGVFINAFGTVPTLRVIYVLAFISMTSMFLIRNHFTEETTIGRELMKHHSKISLKEKWQDYKSAIRYMVSNKLTILIFLIVILTNFQLSFQYFLVIYLKDAIGVTESLTSLIPGISAFVNLIVYLFFIPRMMKKGEAHNLVIGLALCVVGAVSLLLVPYKGFLILLISTIFSAIGNMLMSIFRDTLWNNSIGEEERANIFSAGQAIVNTIAIPSGIIAGVLYQMEWIYPFIVSLAIFTVSFIISLYIKKKLPNP